MSYIELPNTFKVQDKQYFIDQKIDPQICDWLLDPNSLTARIIQHCKDSQESNNNSFRVEVLNQCTEVPSNSEMLRLNMQANEKAHIREVLLYCGEKAVIYAKTIIPLSTLTGKQKELTSLGNKPLGAYLFSQPDLLRDDIEVSQINHHYQQKQEQLWARRSAFYLDHKPLLVYEVFLPELIENLPFLSNTEN